MDLWSLAMMLFDVMEPGSYPYKSEYLAAAPYESVTAFLKEQHTKRKLPRFSDRFQHLWESVWLPLKNVFDMCTSHDPSKRPSAKEVMRNRCKVINSQKQSGFLAHPVVADIKTSLKRCKFTDCS